MPGRSRSARKRRPELSQHFLREARAARLVQATSITDSDFVIEVGPGRGALTKPLSRRAGRLLAVEADPFLADRLAREFSDTVTVHSGDFLHFNLPDEPYRVVGNLPYTITTNIIRKLVTASPPPTDCWLVVQRELAHRFCGRPYLNESLWSLRLKPHWHVEIVHRLERKDFQPAPSVESVMLWMSKRERPLLADLEFQLYLDVVRTAFERGQTLRHALRPWLSRVQLLRLAGDLCFAPTQQPSSLAFEQWLGVVRYLASGAPTKP